ncbi:MAG: bifunctional demethylmenaquinone methyltransferase/2-methoxy-6-polyprenyl-1,4-benzoquinol methylase UbiE [Candidatus Zixiibacteriota bacterium]
MLLTGDDKLFRTIADRYDLLNHLLSLNIDRGWRKSLVKCAGLRTGERILDVCTGTGDIAIRFAREGGAGKIVGIDLSEEMLRIAEGKAGAKGLEGRITLLRGDALSLPFPKGSFDIVSIGFGLRNLRDRQKGISETVRILKPGGRALILEFAPPGRGIFGVGYQVYLKTIIPLIGGIVSGSMDAYRYFSASIVNFLEPDEVVELLQQEGLGNIHFKALTGGIAYIYQGEKE